MLSKAAGTTVTNCLIHHMGYYPYDIVNNPEPQHGYGFYIYGALSPICVSNVIYDCNESAVYPRGPTNLIVWGNDFSLIQDHAIIGGVNAGYTLVACNKIHDQTNQVTHDDGIQIQGFGDGTNCLIIANNIQWNNSQDLFLNLFGNAGTAYIFGNVLINNASVDGKGDDGYYNGMIIYTTQGSVNHNFNNLYVFNNDLILKNGGSGGFRLSGNYGANYLPSTNLYFFNNLLCQSYAVTTASPTNLLNIHAGYNCETNALRGNWLGANEVNSVYGIALFDNVMAKSLPLSNWHPSIGSSAIGAGTNLSSSIPATIFGFLPSAYQIDPTRDPAGNPRGSTWAAGRLRFYPAGREPLLSPSNLQASPP